MRREEEWREDDPWGTTDLGKQRRWRRPWNQYVVYVLGFLSAVMLVGAVGNHRLTLGVGAGCLGAAAVCFLRSDGPAWKVGPRPAAPTLATELGWVGGGVLLVLAGTFLAG